MKYSENCSRDETFQRISAMLRSPMPLELQLQDYLYDTLIGTQPLTTPQEIYNLAAEVYYYQILLNKKIGRICVVGSETDNNLMSYVHHEMCCRLPQMKAIPMNPEFTRQVMAVYRETYIRKLPEDPAKYSKLQNLRAYMADTPEPTYEGAVAALHTPWSPPGVSYVQYISARLEKIRNTPEQERTTSIDCSNQFYRQLEMTQKVSFVKEPPGDKDMLYIICIALGFDHKDFFNLRSIIQREKKDCSLFADNYLSDRDAILQSVLEQIDLWYETVRVEENLSETSWVPKQVLLRVDRMLMERGYPLLYAPRKTRRQKKTDSET